MTMPDSLSGGDLRTRFCERFGCAASEFEHRALAKCLYLHARMIAPLLRLLNPKFFERDLRFIHYFGNAKDWQEVSAEVLALRYQDLLHPRFARNALRLRVSGRKANKLAGKLLPP